MSGGKKTIETKSTTAPAAWLDPMNHQLANQASALASTPFKAYDGELVPGFNSDQLAAFDAVKANAAKNQPGMDAARANLSSTINGGNQNQYIGQLANWGSGPNPYLDSVVNSSLGDITRSYGGATGNLLGQFSQGGSFGGSAHEEAMANAQNELAQNLARTTTGLRYQDYNDQQNRKFSGLGQAAGLTDSGLARQLSATLNMPAFNAGSYADANAILGIGNQQQQNQQALDAANYGQYINGQNYGFNQLQALGSASNSLNGAYHTQTDVKPNPDYKSPFQQLLGAGMMVGGVMTGNPMLAMGGAGSLFGGGGGASGGGGAGLGAAGYYPQQYGIPMPYGSF